MPESVFRPGASGNRGNYSPVKVPSGTIPPPGVAPG